MKNSNVNFALSFLAVLSLSSCFISKETTISEPLQTITYSSVNKVHARGLTASDAELIIAASNGLVYFYPKESKKIYCLFPSPKKEYRDVIFHENKIVVLASGDSSEVFRYSLENSDKIFKTPFNATFLDGMDFFGNTIFMMGDPKEGKFSLYKSTNWGETWTKLTNPPDAYSGEAGYAASGTNVKVTSENDFFFVSGGDSSRFFKSIDAGETWMSKSMGFPSCSTCGSYSFTITKKGTIVAAGGDYLKPEEKAGTCRISRDGGKTWQTPKILPSGYRSNVTEIKGVLYCCGSNGIDFSKDEGLTWASFAKGNYFTLCLFDNKLAASTTNGTIHLFKLK